VFREVLYGAVFLAFSWWPHSSSLALALAALLIAEALVTVLDERTKQDAGAAGERATAALGCSRSTPGR
jgi:hypothetical protein